LFLPPVYKSEARLLALPGDYYSVRDDPQRITGNESLQPEDVMNVEMQLLSSRDLKLEAIERSGVLSDEADEYQRAVDYVDSALLILPVAKANVIELSYKGSSPESAQEMLETILQSYFAMRADVFTSGRLDLLLRQRDAARDDLQNANEALSTFQRANNVGDVEEQITGAVEINTALRRDLADARAVLSGARGALEQQLIDVSALPQTVEIFRDNTEAMRARSDIEAQLLILEAERADLQRRYMEGSPYIEKIDAQIYGLRQALEQTNSDLPEARRLGRSTAYDEAASRVRESETLVSRTESRISQLEEEIAESEARLQKLNRLAVEISDLEVQREVTENRFRALAGQVEETRSRMVEAGTGSANVRVIQQPTLPSKPTRSISMVLLATTVVALIVAVSTAFVLANIREVPVDANDAADSFGLQILGDLSDPETLASLPTPEMLRLASQSELGRVIGVVGVTNGIDPGALEAFVRPFSDAGRSAVVTFEPSAYDGLSSSREPLHEVTNHNGRYLVGSRSWLEGDTGEETLSSLRAEYRWILFFIPSSCSSFAEELQIYTANEADENIVFWNTETRDLQKLGALIDRLKSLSRPLRGLVIANF
ncbi:MAG: hypothetical protein AAFW82_06890, partial [Pseudomonadota bacterium]